MQSGFSEQIFVARAMEIELASSSEGDGSPLDFENVSSEPDEASNCLEIDVADIEIMPHDPDKWIPGRNHGTLYRRGLGLEEQTQAGSSRANT